MWDEIGGLKRMFECRTFRQKKSGNKSSYRKELAMGATNIFIVFVLSVQAKKILCIL